MFFIDNKLQTNSLKTKTRKHCSRICTTRLETSFVGGNEMREIQEECVPVGCIPPAPVADFPARTPPLPVVHGPPLTHANPRTPPPCHIPYHACPHAMHAPHNAYPPATQTSPLWTE